MNKTLAVTVISGITVIMALGMMAPALADVPDEKDGKVTICHQTSNPNSDGVTITISEKALAKHLAHGDFTGECGLVL